jgi:hypothetical protein
MALTSARRSGSVHKRAAELRNCCAEMGFFDLRWCILWRNLFPRGRDASYTI